MYYRYTGSLKGILQIKRYMSASQPWETQSAQGFTWEISTFVLEFPELEIKGAENLI